MGVSVVAHKRPLGNTVIKQSCYLGTWCYKEMAQWEGSRALCREMGLALCHGNLYKECGVWYELRAGRK